MARVDLNLVTGLRMGCRKWTGVRGGGWEMSCLSCNWSQRPGGSNRGSYGFGVRFAGTQVNWLTTEWKGCLTGWPTGLTQHSSSNVLLKYQQKESKADFVGRLNGRLWFYEGKAQPP